MDRVAVVGGGLAGLVAARRLADEDVAVTLYEARDRLGGRIGSERRDGFVLDRGFQVLFPAYPAVRRELDLDALELRSFRPGALLARPGERSIVADPLGDPRALTPTLFDHSVTVRDLWRLLRLRRELASRSTDAILRRDDRSIAEALRDRGFSESARTSFLAPFFGGITLDRSLSSAEFVFEYAFKMLVAGGAALPADGMQAIPEQLATRARESGVDIQLETSVERLEVSADSVTLEFPGLTDTVDGVVVATDPASARRLTGVASIPTATRGCVTQHFSLPTSQQLRANRRLILNAADDRPNHVAVVSDVVDSYAPAGRHLLSATFLGVPDEGDGELATSVRESLSAWFPENSFGDLDLLATHRFPDAQVAQPPGFRGDVPAADTPDGPVVLAGDYTRWSSIQGALESGRVASRVLPDVP